jgi:hypothetical protein
MKTTARNSHQSHMPHRGRSEPRGNGAHWGHSARRGHRGHSAWRGLSGRTGRPGRAWASPGRQRRTPVLPGLPSPALRLSVRPLPALPFAAAPPGKRRVRVFGVIRPGFTAACMVEAAVARRVTADVSRGAVKDHGQRRSQKQTKRIFRAWLAEARRYRGARPESHGARAAEGAGPAFDYLK